VTEEDRNAVVARLTSSFEALRAAVSGLSDAQWRFKPAPDLWSVADCVEHLAVGEAGLVARLQAKIAEEAPSPHPETANKDSLVLRAVPRRKIKVKAPPEMEVKSPKAALSDGMDAFGKVRSATIAFVASTPADLRAYWWPHFSMGPLDGWQWMLLAALHSERHTQQIEEIKTHPQFPGAA
jgi:hypothetical protein